MKVSSLMKEYFNREEPEMEFDVSRLGLHKMKPGALPVAPSSTSWKMVKSPNRLMKTYKFDSFEFFIAFLDELLRYQESLQHHAKLTVQDREVIVEVWTHTVDDVTEMDQEYAKTCDSIYSDTRDYTRSRVQPNTRQP